MSLYTVWDPGGCNCPTPGLTCGSCVIPTTNLNISFSSTDAIFGTPCTVSSTLTYASSTWSLDWCAGTCRVVKFRMSCATVAGSLGPFLIRTDYGNTACSPTGGTDCTNAVGGGLTTTGLTCGSGFLWTLSGCGYTITISA